MSVTCVVLPWQPIIYKVYLLFEASVVQEWNMCCVTMATKYLHSVLTF